MNSEETNPYQQRNFELRMIIGVIAMLLLLLGGYTQKKADENASLRSTLQQLETSFSQQLEKNRQRYDSLQQHLELQDALHRQLKDSLARFEVHRTHLKKRSNENKAAIARLRDADSLRELVARHYR